MESRIDADPDPDVLALQSVDALLRSGLLELRPALLRAEQRQRDRECRRAKAARTTNRSAHPLDQDGRLAG